MSFQQKLQRWATRRRLGSLALLALVVPLWLPSEAGAATGVIKVLMDLDNNPSTGCTINTPAGPFAGAEQVVVTTFDTSSNQVTSVQVQVCSAGVLGGPAPVNGSFSPPWPIGATNGVNGSTLIETYFPLAGANASGPIRAGFTVGDQQGDQDALLPTTLIPSGITAVPMLSGIGLAVLSLLVLVVGFALLRLRGGALGVVGALVVAVGFAGVAWAAVALTGQTSDWIGISPLGTKASTQPGHAEILAVYGVEEGANLFFRVDASIPSETLAITSANQTAFTAGVGTIFSVTTSGLPAPSLSATGPLPSGVSFMDNGDGTAKLLGSAATGSGGAYPLTLRAHNAVAADATQSFTLTVIEGPPSLGTIPDQTIPLGSTYSVRLYANDPNPSAALTYSLDAMPAGAVFNPNPIIVWTPTAAQLGANTFTARVVDGAGHFDVKTFHVNVTSANRPPQLAAQPDATIAGGGTFTRTLTATDPDAGQTLTFSLVSGPPGLALTGGNQLLWQPVTTTTGDYYVTVRVTDNGSPALSDSARFRLTVVPATRPVAQDDAYQVMLGQTLTISPPGVLANDLGTGPLTASKLSDPDKGSLSAFNADGSFVYQAPAILPGPVFAPVVRYHVDSVSYSDPPLVADVDGDGKPELIFPGVGGSAQAGISAVRGTDGSVLWHTPALPAPYSDCEVYYGAGALFHIAVGDIDDSGQLSIVMPTSCGRDNLPTGIVGTNAARYLALNAKDGTVKWLSPPLGKARDAYGNARSWAFGTVPTIARLRVGETPSILVGADGIIGDTLGTPCNDFVPGWPAGVGCRGVFALGGKDGAVRQSMAAPYPYPYPPDGALSGNGTSASVAADLDGDGNVEILYGGAIFNNDGSVRFNNNDVTGLSVDYWVGLGNFDDTPDIEVLRIEDNGFGGVKRLAVYKSDGRLLWSLPLPNTSYIGTPVVADVDGSGRPAVVLVIDGNVCAVDYRGNYKWCHDVGAPGGVSNVGLGSRVQVYDLEGTGVPEVIVQVNGEILLFLDGATGNVKYSLDLGAANGPPFWPPYLDYGVGGPIVADLDGSGHAAIATLWGGVGRLDVVAAQNNDWRPARKVFNQESYQFGNINDDGTIPLNFVNNFAIPATNVFGNQAQILTPVDPRLHSETTFTYAASDGTLTSSPGTVTIDILPVIRPPVFVSKPPSRYVAPDYTFTYAAQAIDPNPGGTVTYSLKLARGNGGGQGCSMDATSGLLSCSALFSGDQTFVIVATDNYGAAAYQNILLHESPGPAAVPNVVGLTQAAAGTALTAAGFTTGNVTQTYFPAPAGQVVSQAPAAGAQLLLGESVDLTVSLGPTPQLVPNVVGKTLSSATSTLAGQGFSAGVTTYQYDTTQPQGTVLAQDPAGGVVVAPGPVALTVSAGTGLVLRLSQSFTTADVPITFTPIAIDLAGNESPAPPLNYDPIAANPAPFAGPLPTRTGTTITFDPLTRGAFRLSATDPVSGHAAFADFAVAQPIVPGEDGDVGEFAKLSTVFEGLDALARQAKVALLANDDATMRARLTDIVNLWRTITVEDLKISTPFSPDGGFPPTIDDMAGFGVTPGPDDAVNKQLLVQIAADLQAWIDGLNANNTPLAELNALSATFADDTSRLTPLRPGEYGAVDAAPDYALVIGHRIPDLMEAVMNQIGQVVALPPRTTSFPGLSSARKARNVTAGARVTPQNTLAELLVGQAVQYVIDTITGARQFTVAVLCQAAYGMASVAIAAHLKAFLQAQDPAAIVAGASLSFREFNAPFSMIEGVGLEKDYPDLNTVVVVGPDLFLSVQALVTKMKAAAKFNLNPNDPSGVPRYQNIGQIKSDLKQFKGLLEGVLAGAQNLVDQAKKAFQSTTVSDAPCLFTDDRSCVELMYPDGFHSVYTYSPPPGFGDFSGLPLPIIFIVRNNVNGQLLFDTPPFLPCNNTPQNPHNCD